MAIRLKERELAAVGISVAAGCKPCTDHHVKQARTAGASDEEIKEAVDDAVSVRKSATEIMEAHALAHVGESGPESGPDAGPVGETSRVKELVSVGAAFAVNCVSNLEKHLAAAGTVGVSREDIAEIVKLAAFIKERAASHADRPVAMGKEDAA
jgi:AhpD family alkylhydroperoxidase